MKFQGAILILSLFVLISCDKIEDPFPPVIDEVEPDTGIIWDDSVFSVENDGKRFVLMEEFTGHTCTNCPAGAAEMERLAAIHGEQLVTVSVHASSFAQPKPGYGNTGDGFSSNYRTDAGEAYLGPLGVNALPGGLVSRIEGSALPDQTSKLTSGEWSAKIADIIGKQAIANLSLANYYDDSTKTYQVQVSIEWITAHSGDLNLQLFLLEDSIIDWQQDARFDPNPYIEDYMHRHMLRGHLNGIWGEPLDNAAANELTEITYNRAFDSEGIGYKLEHMIIVAFIYKRGGPIYEVMQVNEAHLTSH